MWFLPFLAALGGTSVLDGAAMSSPRPALCKPVAGFWGRLAQREQRVFCTELAKAYARLSHQPAQAQQHAQRALGQLEDPAAFIALARALSAQQRHAEAWQAFEQSAGRRANDELVLSVQVLGGTGALHALARTAAMSGHSAVALDAYRGLVPRLDLLPEGQQVAGLVEAAMAVLRQGAAVEEAVSYLANAYQRRGRRASESYLAAVELLQARIRANGSASGGEVDGSWLEQHLRGVVPDSAPYLPEVELRLLLALVLEQRAESPQELVQPLLAAQSGLAPPLRRWAEQWWSSGEP